MHRFILIYIEINQKSLMNITIYHSLFNMWGSIHFNYDTLVRIPLYLLHSHDTPIFAIHEPEVHSGWLKPIKISYISISI